MRKRGFTLIELLIVIAIIGIIAAIAIPMYQTEKLKAKVMPALDNSWMCSVVNNPKLIEIRGRCIVWDTSNDTISPVNSMLDSSIRAKHSDKYVTILALNEWKRFVGHYSLSNEPAYRQYADISVIYLPEKAGKWRYSLLVYDPPKSRKVGQKDEKPDPSRIVAKFIENLPKVDIPVPNKDQIEELIPAKDK